MSQPNMVDRARWRLRQALGIHSPSRPTETPTTPAKVYALAITLGTISGAICWVLTGWLGL